MKNLRIWYDNENDERIYREYKFLVDFVNEMESNNNVDIPMLDYSNVDAIFWGDKMKHFNSIDDLLKYCKGILQTN